MAWSSEGVRLTLFLVLDLVTQAVGEVDNSTYSSQDAVRWDISEFGACSVACGGGIQVRTIRCVRSSQKFGVDKEIRVPESLCPLPVPPLTLSCNSQACTAQWTKGEWSQCTVTCGTGTQMREVTCQSAPLQGRRYHVAPSECGGLAPESSRKCHIADCPFHDKIKPYSILSENYTLIQLHRTKKIKVNIGGQVHLLPGQTIVVKCPVKHYSKQLIYWSTDYRLVPFMGRVRSTPGGLYISKGDPSTDAGVYTCIAGNLTASITVLFIGKDDPSTVIYKQWLKNSNKKNHHHKYKIHGHRNNDILTSAGEINYEELNQQRDQSHNSSHSSLVYVTGDWSPCSAACGLKGHRKRKVSCSHMTPKYVKIVPDLECQALGLDKPETIEECSTYKHCAIWRPGPWSQCLPSCGPAGHMTRLLTCAWESTGQSAGTACDLNNKPTVSKPCKTRPCPLECSDSSEYCDLARMLKLCRFYHFQQQCCLTCERQQLIQGQ
ncbi:unnamed protein product [Candidula unifasciata]|uniref:ADAMTS-like protein 3 n=1 Tax=Candidula unifasciata TaxID=100452 RepID=A0A8S3ZD34_9EUPU|nr:unnamed protein product [Candidula unifasciata]